MMNQVVQAVALRHLSARIGLSLVDMHRENKLSMMQTVIGECNAEVRKGVLEFLTEPVGEGMEYRLRGPVLLDDSFNVCYNGLHRYVASTGVAGVTVSNRCTIYPEICDMLMQTVWSDSAKVTSKNAASAPA